MSLPFPSDHLTLAQRNMIESRIYFARDAEREIIAARAALAEAESDHKHRMALLRSGLERLPAGTLAAGEPDYDAIMRTIVGA